MKTLLTVALVVSNVATALAESGTPQSATRPHLVVLLADDHSAADMSVYGAQDIPTPHLDRMAAAGMVFERAYVNSPSCAPSRAALFTGMYPARNGAEANHSRPGESIKRLPAYLKELGYEVVSFGKTSHYAHVKEQGFDSVQGFEYHDHTCVQASIDFLKQRQSEKPLALFFGTHWPHVPLPQPEEVDPVTVRIQPMHIDTPEFRHYRARYINAVKKMDTEIGAVYEAAKTTLGTENTFFLQTSDHGAQLPFGKWNLYEEGTRVPLIVQWQGKIAPGTRTHAMAQWIDILPTLIEVARGASVPQFDGKSLLPVLTGATEKHRHAIFTTHSGDGNFNVYPCRSVRDERWKYIRNLHPEYRHATHIDRSGERTLFWESWEKAAASDPNAATILNRYRQRPSEELYDLESDPFELNNLAQVPTHSEAKQKLSTQLDQWMQTTTDKQQTFGQPLLLTDPFTTLEVKRKKGK
jgi:N-sulfoglucosamine sulfohydrolase